MEKVEIELKEITRDGVEVDTIFIVCQGRAFELSCSINERIYVQPCRGKIDLDVSINQLECIVTLVDYP